MKINGNIEKIMRIYKKQPVQNKKANRVSKTETVHKSDKIELSREAKDFQAALDAVKQIPDIRQDKVEEIKSKILTGAYNVSAEEVAGKIVEGIIINEKI